MLLNGPTQGWLVTADLKLDNYHNILNKLATPTAGESFT